MPGYSRGVRVTLCVKGHHHPQPVPARVCRKFQQEGLPLGLQASLPAWKALVHLGIKAVGPSLQMEVKV